METNELNVSRNIKALRTRKGLTQEDISSKIVYKSKQLSLRTYKKIENHPFSYPIHLLNEIAGIIGCNINQFFLKD